MKEESLLLLSDLQKLINQVVLIDYTIIILGCDNVRDQYMVDHCDVLLAIWDGNKSGGVWSTIRKTQKAGKKIIYCPKEILREVE